MTDQNPGNESHQAAERSDADTNTGVRVDPRQKWLIGRISKWRDSDLISDEQSEAILNFESMGRTPFQLGVRFNRLIVVLSTLGAILIAGGIISFVAANWQGIPALVKLFLLIGGQTASYWIAYQLQFVRGYPGVGGAVMLAGAAWFGANVFLVAQTYHLATDNPDLMIWWFLGILPLAYIARSQAITVMAVGIFIVGIAWKTAAWVDDSDNFFIVVGILALEAAAIYALGTLHLTREKLKFHAGPYLVGGALLAIGLTYILTFDEVFDDLRYWQIEDFRIVTGSQFVLAGLVSALGIAALAVTHRFSTRIDRSLAQRIGEPAVVGLVIIFGWLMITLPFGSPVFYVVTANLLLLVLIFGSIVLGIVNRREALVNLGIVFFVIDLSTRYIELTVDMLDTSLAFILGGMLLLGVGYAMERARRRLLRHFGMPVGGSPAVDRSSELAE